MARGQNFFRVLGLLCLLIFGASALYEDQAGSFDWSQKYLGEIEFGVFQQIERSHLLLGSRSNVLASVSPKNGQIVWRQVMEEGGTLLFMEGFGKGIFTLSGDSKKIPTFGRMWNIQSGKLLWEISLSSAMEEKEPLGAFLEAVVVDDEKGKSVVFLTESGLVAVAMEGHILWRIQKSWRHLLVSKNTLVAFQPEQQRLSTSVIDIEQGKILSEAVHQLSSQGHVVVGRKLVLPQPQLGKIIVIDFASENPAPKEYLVADIVSKQLGSFSALSLHGKAQLFTSFALHAHDAIYLISLAGSTPKLLNTLSNEHDQVVILESYESKDYLVRIIPGKDGRFDVYDLSVQEPQTSIPFPSSLESSGLVRKGFLGFFPKKESGFGFRVVVAQEDGSVSLMRESLQWTREEALARISHVSFVDLPLESIFVKSDLETDEKFLAERSAIENFVHRVVKHADVLKNVTVGLGETLQSLFSWEKGARTLVSDRLSLRKILVVTTEAGKVFGVDSADGSIVWRLFFPGASRAQTLLMRSPASYSAISLLIADLEDKTLLAYFNPITGEIESGSPFLRNFRVNHVMKLPITAAHHTHFVLVVDDSLKVHAFPEDKKLSLEQPLHFFLYDASVRGYEIVQDENGSLETKLTWTFVPPTEEKIVTVAQKFPLEKVASLGRVLGDRRVLYKYLNPHLIGVATTTAHVLHIYLVDSVSGGLLSHHFHHFCGGDDVIMAVSEHWVVYHYWHQKMGVYMVSVLELFESVVPDVRISSSNFSSYDNLLPEILSQTYIFPTGARTLAVSQTKRGITSRQLLVGISQDQIYGIPKRFLDPRRHLGAQSNDDKEEGLFPYEVLLPLNQKMSPTYNHTIARLQKIETFPTNLESTSLVFAFGLDLFFTQITPSKTFDSLTDEFQYELLLATIALLSVALVVSSRLARWKMLNNKWK